MKLFIRFSLLTSALLSAQAFALSPIDGFYGGIMAEVSHGPSNRPVVFVQGGMTFTGTVGYSSISGGGGGFLGYQYKNFRFEGEALYNRISTGPVKVGTCTIQNFNIATPTGLCPAGTYDGFKANALGYSGSSASMFGLANAYWEFFSPEGLNDLIPYVGFGAGVGQVKNGNSFINTITQFSTGGAPTTKGLAYQGIFGLNYFLDDFTWVGMDFRYLAVNLKKQNNTVLDNTKTYSLQTLNFIVGFSFDKGAMD